MARSRNIKPGLFKNEILGVADPLCTLLFEGLWLLADRAGRLEDRPLRIKGEVFPYRDFDADAGLEWLQSQGFILRFESGGKKYIQVLEFARHQSPHKNESESVIPAPDGFGTNPEKVGSPRADSGFLDTDSGLLEKPARTKPKKTETELPEGFGISDRVRDWAKRGGYTRLEEHLEHFTLKAKARNYRYADWDAAFMGAIRDDWAKLKDKQAPPRHTDDAERTSRMLAEQNKGTRAMPAEIRQLAAQLTGRKAA